MVWLSEVWVRRPDGWRGYAKQRFVERDQAA